MRVLVTGATGFVGSHVVDHVLEHTGWEVVGLSRSLRHVTAWGRTMPRLSLRTADLNEPGSVDALMAEVRPDAVIHLAGQPLEPLSWQDPAATFRLNVIGQVHLFEAMLKAGIRPRTVIGGSALMYGLVKDEENPIDEDQPLRPTSPYAVSKLSADFLGYQYFISRKLPVLRMRPFNQIGPRQSPEFVVAAFAKQIAEIEAGHREPVIRVGNLTSVRDFMDVRDAASAYCLAVERGEPGEAYNVGSGEGRTGQFVLDQLLAMSSATIRVETDPERFRPVDLPRIVCDATKFRRASGWAPAIAIETSLRDTLHWWREELSRS
ncbi:MAG TPA: GDP-mannose 4,6-dehydratase [Chloroflexota bacterium]|nr:GDP-mannose 4,6-dehydratase [Chloroflexota bacterium]